MAAVAADGQADSQDTDGASNLSSQLQRFGWVAKNDHDGGVGAALTVRVAEGLSLSSDGFNFQQIRQTVAE